MNNQLFSFPPAFRRFWSDLPARYGVLGILFLLIPALYAPFIANGYPLVWWQDELSFPWIRQFFAPANGETWVEKGFNFFALFLPLAFAILKIGKPKWLCLVAALILIPFFAVSPRLDKSDYRNLQTKSVIAIFPVLPYSPGEICGSPYEKPNLRHPLGCDDIGRDVAVRLIYGARASLSVGIAATAISLLIGTVVGLAAGYFRGWFDLAIMRFAEIMLCFPTFLLLLILMSLLGDYKFEQSVPVVIGVIGLTGWIGLAYLVRGEVLKQSALPYVKCCIVSGLPAWKIMIRHLLPNVSASILINFTFGVAGAISAESSLSFLGFGVQPPTASWGGLLRQAFDNPLDYWHLTLFPGLALFIAVLSFNFTGEGLRRFFDPREGC